MGPNQDFSISPKWKPTAIGSCDSDDSSGRFTHPFIPLSPNWSLCLLSLLEYPSSIVHRFSAHCSYQLSDHVPPPPPQPLFKPGSLFFFFSRSSGVFRATYSRAVCPHTLSRPPNFTYDELLFAALGTQKLCLLWSLSKVFLVPLSPPVG